MEFKKIKIKNPHRIEYCYTAFIANHIEKDEEYPIKMYQVRIPPIDFYIWAYDTWSNMFISSIQFAVYCT